MMSPRCLIAFLIGLTACAGPIPTESVSNYSRPLSPEEAAADFRVDPHFRVEVFAAEPFVRDPVDLAFDAYGRAYVAEMLDYPFEEGAAPHSRIRLLTDADDDGRIDDAVVFADSLTLIAGIQPWDGGLIVASAPDILFLRDVDGDGRADERRTLFTGFAEANPQHRIASPRFAVDNWIYVANDGAPGSVEPVAPLRGEPASVLGADFRFRMPVGGAPLRYEPASGPAQFGQAFDAYGRRFITHNTVHVRHVVLPRAYFTRNPYLTSAPSATDISDHGLRVYQTSEPQAWRVSRSTVRQQRYDAEGVDRTEQRADVFTAVAGAAIAGEAAYPPAYRGNLFTGETAANLVHRDVLRPAGPTFAAARGGSQTEFLTSTDPWFRPSNVVVGPDGFLYVVDMYRAIIESPEYIPESIRADLDFRRGTEYGRIYRIVPQDRRGPDGSSSALAEAPASALVDVLADPNPWRRLTAHRLLLERGDRTIVGHLDLITRHAERPYTRLHAFYVLDGLGAMSEEVAARALGDPHAGVREHALRFAESYPSLGEHAAALAADPSDRVRMQAALSLGTYGTPSADSALVELAVQRGNDPWFAAAILSAPSDRAIALLEGLLRSEGEAESLVGDLAGIIGARMDPFEIVRLLTLLEAETPERQEAALSGLARGFELRGVRHLEVPGLERAMQPFLQATAEQVVEAALHAARHVLMPELAAAAARTALDPRQPSAGRTAAAANLVAGRFGDVQPMLVQLLESGEARLQAAALAALGRFTDDEVASAVLGRWSLLSPPLRREASAVLASRSEWLAHLLDAAQENRIETEVLPTDVRLRLLDHPDASIRAPAAELLDRPPSGASASVLQLEGDVDRGRSVFYRECAHCHASSGLGPNLVGVSNKSREQLLEAVVAPSNAIPATYAAYVAERSDGSVLSGRIVREMPGTLTFLSEREERSVLRSDIRSLRAASRSLMPEDYGSRLEHQELADVIAYLRAAEE